MKACFVSLGCPKNLTDTEVLMGKFTSLGYQITTSPAQAEVIVVNTCAFLKTARDEALSVIKEMAQWKKKGRCQKLYLAGCLPKYRKSTIENRQSKIGYKELIDGEIDSINLFNYKTPRIKATQPWTAYVKIAEGCNNSCAYCLIPKIRGKLRFRKQADILGEVRELSKRGVKEIIYIAQDTTAYPFFDVLLRKTARIKGVRWIRIMYAHPAHLTEKVLETISREKKIVKYLDLPIQHACDKILSRMNRRVARRDLESLILNIRRRKITLRSSVIVGFPGENETDFAQLLDFVRWARFQKLGLFAYQREAGTPAAEMREQVSERIKKVRVKKLMQAQARISKEMNTMMIGRTIEVIIERGIKGGSVGRAYFDAPEIDGSVIVNHHGQLSPGEIVKVRLTGAKTYDLIGTLT